MTQWTREPIAKRHEGNGSKTQTRTMTKLKIKGMKTRTWNRTKNRPYNRGVICLAGSNSMELILMMDLFLTNMHLFTCQDVNWRTGVDYCDVLSAVWSLILTAPIHCTLVSKWCNATFLQIFSDQETNSSWIALGWVYFQQFFGWTTPLTYRNNMWRGSTDHLYSQTVGSVGSLVWEFFLMCINYIFCSS